MSFLAVPQAHASTRQEIAGHAGLRHTSTPYHILLRTSWWKRVGCTTFTLRLGQLVNCNHAAQRRVCVLLASVPGGGGACPPSYRAIILFPSHPGLQVRSRYEVLVPSTKYF